jgi:hypothetical protein
LSGLDKIGHQEDIEKYGIGEEILNGYKVNFIYFILNEFSLF